MLWLLSSRVTFINEDATLLASSYGQAVYVPLFCSINYVFR